MIKDDQHRIQWCFPCYFFMFLFFFISVKFVFIFFFNASFEPAFIFDLTPFHLFKSLDNLQLLFLSLTFLMFEAYLHYHSTRKNLIYSFIPTAFLLTGLGLAITSKVFSFTNVFYYIIFLCLLLVVLIDHRHILEHPESFEEHEVGSYEDFSKKKTPKVTTSVAARPFKTPSAGVYAKIEPTKKHEQPISLDDLSDLKISESELDKALNLLKRLDAKQEKIGRIEEEIEERRKILVNDEQNLSEKLKDLSGLQRLSNSNTKSKNVISEVDKDLKSEDSADFFDDVKQSAFIVQKGKIEKINQSFSELLGYQPEDIVHGDLLDLVIPKDYSSLEKYYLKRLNGEPVSSYEATFRTKDDNRISLKVDFKPTKFNGKKAQIAVVSKKE